jgi:hypothetical protein
MPKSFAERLGRFTPNMGGLDRDTLLFAAGQASVRRPTRLWSVLVGALAASQLLTVVLLWPGPKSPVGPMANSSPAAEVTMLDTPPLARETTDEWVLSRRALQSDNGEWPRDPAVERLVVAGPPLRAWTASATMALD